MNLTEPRPPDCSFRNLQVFTIPCASENCVRLVPTTRDCGGRLKGVPFAGKSEGGAVIDWQALTRRASDLLQRPSRRQLLALGLLTASCMGASSALAIGGGRPASFEAIDRDRDGTIDLDEVKRAAALLFGQLDRQRTGKLSRAQLGRGRMTLAEFSWADRDHDGTLTKDEYLALVERQFRAADLDRDGTVSAAEFKARSGLPLRRLLY